MGCLPWNGTGFAVTPPRYSDNRSGRRRNEHRRRVNGTTGMGTRLCRRSRRRYHERLVRPNARLCHRQYFSEDQQGRQKRGTDSFSSLTVQPSMSLSTLPVFARWGVLIALSVLFAALLTWARLPAALLLGSMIAGILVENGGAGILVPQLPFGFAQAIIGCMIARVLTFTIIHSFLHEWPLFLGISFLVIVASCLLGWLISRFRILPETTAIWGLLPGAASAMMVMADAYGADARLVAFMQYVPVLMVALVASLIARFWVHAPAVAAGARAVWFAPIHALPFLETLVLVLGGVILGPVFRIAAGILLIPMLLGAVLASNGLVEIELPSWLLAVSYLLLGWTIGLRFTREILVYALRALL